MEGGLHLREVGGSDFDRVRVCARARMRVTTSLANNDDNTPKVSRARIRVRLRVRACAWKHTWSGTKGSSVGAAVVSAETATTSLANNAKVSQETVSCSGLNCLVQVKFLGGSSREAGSFARTLDATTENRYP